MKRIALISALALSVALGACMTPYVPPAATATTAPASLLAPPVVATADKEPLLMPGAPFPDLPPCAKGPDGIGGCSFDQIGQWAHPGIRPGDPNYGTATGFGGTGTAYGARTLPPFGAARVDRGHTLNRGGDHYRAPGSRR